jgi:3-oxoacyl-[acyl-carrier-protein] synthase-3
LSFIASFGSYVPPRVVGNADLAARLGCTPEWIVQVSGIEERRYAEADQTVVDLAFAAAEDCLSKAGVAARDLGMLLVSSGSSDRRFPGPAAAVASRLGLEDKPAIDVPMASAGSLFAMSLASRLAETVGPVLVVASEKMSTVIAREPQDKNIAILFGDGAGACLIGSGAGRYRILDSHIASDGSFTADLNLPLTGPLQMNGYSVIMQASRKMPRAIATVLERNAVAAASVEAFLLHQANQNLIDRVAKALGVESARFYSNIRRYGNTSSASMLIAASEWDRQASVASGAKICFAAFGAGFHWGALLAEAE